jgi:hypothetical protein
VVEPNGDERSHVGPTVYPDGGDPEELSRFKHVARVVPGRGHGVWVTESRVELSGRTRHKSLPFESPKYP